MVERPDRGFLIEVFHGLARLKPGVTADQATAEGSARLNTVKNQDLRILQSDIFGPSGASITALPLLARALAWMATEPRCANQAYNIVNGDAPRWSELWPRFAAYFGMQAGPERPARLADTMADKEGVWQAVIRKHGLRPTALQSLVLWSYGNYVFAPEWDIISDGSKARNHGFAGTVDTAKMFLDIFEFLRAEKIVP